MPKHRMILYAHIGKEIDDAIDTLARKSLTSRARVIRGLIKLALSQPQEAINSAVGNEQLAPRSALASLKRLLKDYGVEYVNNLIATLPKD